MTYQEALVPLIEEAYSDLFKNAEKLDGKLDFKPTSDNRTPMEMVIECATLPPFLAQTIRNRALPPNTPDEPHASDGFKSIAECRDHFNSVKGELFEAIRSFPSENLLETIETPWGTFTWRDFISYAYWNPMYHVGQLAYIQMMHGDKSMD